MNRPKVSVIIPVFKVEQYIEQCAESLFAQTLDDIEYVFVDDCSPDKSIEVLTGVLERFPARASQVKTLRLESNMGLPMVRKKGLEIISGEYVTFCDSDDWVERDAYQKMYEMAVADSADMVICDFVTEEGPVSHYVNSCHSRERKRLVLNCLYGTDSWSCWNKMTRREVFEAIRCFPAGNYGEDMVLMLQAISGCKKVSHVAEGLYHYRMNPSSISNLPSTSRKMTNFRQCCENIDILESFFARTDLKRDAARGLDHVKLNIKFYLDTIDTEDKGELWKNVFPRVEARAIFRDPVISFKVRVKCLCRTLGIIR